MTRHWLLTSTTYGTWLPGNPRGSVTRVRDLRPGETPSLVRREHDAPGEAWEGELPGLYHSARESVGQGGIVLDLPKAESVFAQLQETATFRRWTLHAVSIMPTHFHAVLEAVREVGPTKLLGDLKAYASRRLTREFGAPTAEWWTRDGSKRPLYNSAAVEAAIHYVLDKQPDPLVVWSRTLGRLK